MKKLFSAVAILASIVGLLYLVYNFLCDRFGCYEEEEDLYSEEFDEFEDGVVEMPIVDAVQDVVEEVVQEVTEFVEEVKENL